MVRNRRSAITAVLVSIVLPAAFADDTPLVAPIATYHSLFTKEQVVHAPGGGVLVASGDDLFVGTYTRTRYDNAPSPYKGDRFHAIDLLYDGGIDRHRWIGLFKSAADRPIAGGWNTFQGAGVWGYDVLNRPQTSLVLGGGIAVSDFGIETSNGTTWPVIPVPLIRFTHSSQWIECSFDFITGPNIHLGIAPDRDVHGAIDVRIDQFRDVGDLIYDAAVGYRAFSVGLKNDTYGFAVDGEDEPFETFYSGVYGAIDVTILTITGGYAFDSYTRYGDNEIDRTGEGFFLKIQALLPLGGSAGSDAPGDVADGIVAGGDE